MKNILLKLFVPSLVLFSTMLLTGCENDKWNDHYDEDTFDLPTQTLKEYIQKEPSLSTFFEMLTSTGYDSVLNTSQAFTVWAPTNDALSGVNTSDQQLVKNIVTNHIARGRLTTSGVIDEPVQMIDGKYIHFSKTGSGFSFGDNNVVDPNIQAINGLLHVIDGYAPYLANLWEFIGMNVNLDSLSSYLYGQNQKIFDPVNSVELGSNNDGQIVYDSVFVHSNPVLKKLGGLDVEDSVYTAVLPDNNAWNDAYSRIETFFNFPEDGGGAKRQRQFTQWTIVKNMVFPGLISQPNSYDSLVSSTGNIFYNPGYIFSNTQQEKVSNGMAYITSQMPFADSTWYKKIKVEAEVSDGRTNTSSSIFTRTSYGTGIHASGNQYILVDPTSVDPSVGFPIPNVLSAKYNIYCVFVPAKIVDPNNSVPTKAKFQLTYISRSSGSTFIKRFTPADNVTNPDGLTKMFVAQYDFEFANVVDEDYDSVAVRLRVTNDVTPEEEQAGDFSRTMRIDCIILEPVSE